MNALNTLTPYWHSGTWVFDDDRFGLSREPFVAGADDVITRMVSGIENAREGFRLTFGTVKFPGAQVTLTRCSQGDGSEGTDYHCEEYDMDGWLCPALLHYFPEPPEKIYAKASPL